MLAEPGDDLSSLEIPPDDGPSKSQTPNKERSESKASPPRAQSATNTSSAKSSGTKDSKQGGKTGPQRYPLYPSVQHLLSENGMSKDEADKIPATGPSGRLLKGDVLAYLGKIEKSHPGELSARLAILAHLDLSNIKLAEPASAKSQNDAKAEPETIIEENLATEIAVPISLVEVLKTQKKLKDTLGLELPTTTFIARAVELANQELPAKKSPPTADDLFNSVLGLDKIKPTTSTGNFIPQVTALPATRTLLSRSVGQRPKSDILDILTSTTQRTNPVHSSAAVFPAETNVFSLTVAKNDVKRATIFLERMKGVLEKDIGTLVL